MQYIHIHAIHAYTYSTYIYICYEQHVNMIHTYTCNTYIYIDIHANSWWTSCVISGAHSWWTSCAISWLEFLPISFIICPQCSLPAGPISGFQLILDLMQAAFLTSRIICSTIILLNDFLLYVLISNVVTQVLHVNISHCSLFFKSLLLIPLQYQQWIQLEFQLCQNCMFTLNPVGMLWFAIFKY